MPRGMKPVGLRLAGDSVEVLVWRAAADARPVPTATIIFKVRGSSDEGGANRQGEGTLDASLGLQGTASPAELNSSGFHEVRKKIH